MFVDSLKNFSRRFYFILSLAMIGVGLPQTPVHGQFLDLRENSSLQPRSGIRDRANSRLRKDSEQDARQQESTQLQPTPSDQNNPNGVYDNRVRESTAIQPVAAESAIQRSQESIQDIPTRSAPPSLPSNPVEPVPADLVPSAEEMQQAAGQETAETPLILPLPIWETQQRVQAQPPSTTTTGYNSAVPSTPPAPQPSSNYILSPSDYVQITVFQEPDLTTETRISQDGTINFPLLGVTKIGGKTINEAVAHIRERLDADYIVNPQVTMTILQYSRGRFTILGEVQRPGSYDMPQEETVTLLDAIGSAGGFTRTAKSTKVTVKRNVNGKEEIITLDAKRMAREGVQPFVIRPGDTITVPTTFF